MPSNFNSFKINENRHFFDYLVLLRPDLIILTLTSILLGYYKGLTTTRTSVGELSLSNNLILSYPTSVVMICLAYVLITSSTYIVNQIVDIETDKLNGKGLMIAANRVQKNTAIYISFFTLFSGFVVILLNRSLDLFFLSIVATMLGLAYSVPPFRLKSKPILDLLSNACAYGLVAFAGGWVLSNTLNWQLVYSAFPYILNFGAIYVVSALADIEGDRLTGVKTTAVLLGEKKSLFVALILTTLSIFSGVYNQDLMIVLPSILSFVLYFWAWSSLSPNSIKRSYRISGFFVTLFILFPQPFVLFTLLLFFVIWRLLYRDFIH